MRIFTIEIELRGYIAPTGQRVTDILLRGHDLAFLPEGAAPAPASWVLVEPDDVLFVVPPPLAAPPAGVGSYELVNVTARIGPYRITGHVHLPSGETLSLDLRDRQPFLPLTAATIHREGGPDEVVDVAIVNLSRSEHVSRVD